MPGVSHVGGCCSGALLCCWCVCVCVASTPAAALVVWCTNTFHCAADGSRDLINSQHLALQPFAVSARARKLAVLPLVVVVVCMLLASVVVVVVVSLSGRHSTFELQPIAVPSFSAVQYIIYRILYTVVHSLSALRAHFLARSRRGSP